LQMRNRSARPGDDSPFRISTSRCQMKQISPPSCLGLAEARGVSLGWTGRFLVSCFSLDAQPQDEALPDESRAAAGWGDGHLEVNLMGNSVMCPGARDSGLGMESSHLGTARLFPQDIRQPLASCDWNICWRGGGSGHPIAQSLVWMDAVKVSAAGSPLFNVDFRLGASPPNGHGGRKAKATNKRDVIAAVPMQVEFSPPSSRSPRGPHTRNRRGCTLAP
jgi:hypothetical protein